MSLAEDATRTEELAVGYAAVKEELTRARAEIRALKGHVTRLKDRVASFEELPIVPSGPYMFSFLHLMKDPGTCRHDNNALQRTVDVLELAGVGTFFDKQTKGLSALSFRDAFCFVLVRMCIYLSYGAFEKLMSVSA